MSINEHPSTLQIPVLLNASLDATKPQKGDSYLDLTAGYGGHAESFLAITSNCNDAVLVDRDDYAIKKLSKFANRGVRLMHKDFVSAAKQLIQEGKRFDIVMVDLGVSSPQLDQSE